MTTRTGAQPYLLAMVLALAGCGTTHAADDAPALAEGVDAAMDDAPAPPDTGECGTIGLECAIDEDCSSGLVCFADFGADAGVSGICVPPARGSCGGWTGEPCATPTDLCVASPDVTDIEFCFEPTQFHCLCRWPTFAEHYDCTSE